MCSSVASASSPKWALSESSVPRLVDLAGLAQPAGEGWRHAGFGLVIVCVQEAARGLGLPLEGRSSRRALERTGIAFSGVVRFGEAADKSLIELGSFGFAELTPDGFPSSYHRVGKDSGK